MLLGVSSSCGEAEYRRPFSAVFTESQSKEEDWKLPTFCRHAYSMHYSNHVEDNSVLNKVLNHLKVYIWWHKDYGQTHTNSGRNWFFFYIDCVETEHIFIINVDNVRYNEYDEVKTGQRLAFTRTWCTYVYCTGRHVYQIFNHNETKYFIYHHVLVISHTVQHGICAVTCTNIFTRSRICLLYRVRDLCMAMPHKR